MQALFIAGIAASTYGQVSQAFSAKAEADMESELFREQAGYDEAQARREKEATTAQTAPRSVPFTEILSWLFVR